MSDSDSRLEELQRELGEVKGLMEYADQLVVQLTETGDRFTDIAFARGRVVRPD